MNQTRVYFTLCMILFLKLQFKRGRKSIRMEKVILPFLPFPLRRVRMMDRLFLHGFLVAISYQMTDEKCYSL